MRTRGRAQKVSRHGSLTRVVVARSCQRLTAGGAAAPTQQRVYILHGLIQFQGTCCLPLSHRGMASHRSVERPACPLRAKVIVKRKLKPMSLTLADGTVKLRRMQQVGGKTFAGPPEIRRLIHEDMGTTCWGTTC